MKIMWVVQYGHLWSGQKRIGECLLASSLSDGSPTGQHQHRRRESLRVRASPIAVDGHWSNIMQNLNGKQVHTLPPRKHLRTCKVKHNVSVLRIPWLQLIFGVVLRIMVYVFLIATVAETHEIVSDTKHLASCLWKSIFHPVNFHWGNMLQLLACQSRFTPNPWQKMTKEVSSTNRLRMGRCWKGRTCSQYERVIP